MAELKHEVLQRSLIRLRSLHDLRVVAELKRFFFTPLVYFAGSLHDLRVVAELKLFLSQTTGTTSVGSLHDLRVVAELKLWHFGPLHKVILWSPRLKRRGRIEAS